MVVYLYIQMKWNILWVNCGNKIKLKFMNRKGKRMPSYIKMWHPNEEQLKKLESGVSFPKPGNWDSMPLYEKSRIYGLQLGEKEGLYSDKLEVKEIVSSIVKVAKVIKILNNDIKQEDINPNHILKSSHGSGWNIDFAKDNKFISIKKKIKMWNKLYNPVNEPHYKYIRPRFFIEEKIQDKTHPNFLITYRFRCIRGVVIAIRVTVEDKLYDYFPDWTPMKDNPDPELPCPEELEEMLRISERLSSIFEFVRIDLYLGKDGIYFSEYTFTPNGYEQIYYDVLEMELSKLWRK